ncbi:MAG: MerR family DNA-binding protein [Solirubrobacteraceae bacterium]
MLRRLTVIDVAQRAGMSLDEIRLLDDAILLACVLRAVLRSGGEELLDEHWRGPARSLELVRRLAFG